MISTAMPRLEDTRGDHGPMTRLIALCGYPRCGKTLLADMIVLRYGAKLVDDGWPLRDFAIRHMGARPDDVTTQEGKARIATMGGQPVMDLEKNQPMTWRQVLGRIGDHLETLMGEDFLPRSALLACTDPDTVYVFPSVRKRQGLCYKASGGHVVEVVRPGTAPTGAFDTYERSCLDVTLRNDGDREAFIAAAIAHFDARLPVIRDETPEWYVAEILRREAAETAKRAA